MVVRGNMYLLLQRPGQAMREVREYSDRVYWSPLTTYVSQSEDRHSQTDAKHNCAKCSKHEGAPDEARYDNIHGSGHEGIVHLQIVLRTVRFVLDVMCT